RGSRLVVRRSRLLISFAAARWDPAKKDVSSTSRGFCSTGDRRHRVYLIPISQNQLLASLFEPNHVPASVLRRAKLIDDHRVVLLINEILQFLLQAFQSSRGDVTFKNRILDPV